MTNSTAVFFSHKLANIDVSQKYAVCHKRNWMYGLRLLRAKLLLVLTKQLNAIAQMIVLFSYPKDILQNIDRIDITQMKILILPTE